MKYMKYIAPAIASVLIALITTLGTINASHNKLQATEEKIGNLSEEATKLGGLGRPPVGTIVASLLPPQDFAQATGDPADFDLARSHWTFADDKGKVPGTGWAKLTGNKPIPDLRGMFLRGINSSRKDGMQDPGGERHPGDYQEDRVGRHAHEYTTAGIWGRSFQGENGQPHTAFEKGGTTANNINDQVETRPRNVAVYYYIRIN